MKLLLQEIASQNNCNLLESKALSGGDINYVFFLKCIQGNFAVKLNDVSKFPKMFEVEAKGLHLLQATKSFKIPKTITVGVLQDHSYLMMEYLETGTPNSKFWETFAENLATLHKTTQQSFGLDHDNYIGSLPQKNNFCSSASEFYITQRLQPQFKMATDNGFQFKNLEGFFKNISEEIPNEPPSLIHGDLWNRNYMVSKGGMPILIDPAVAFAPREMDIAMMKLFGGFSGEVFSYYNAIFPLYEDWKERIPLWQLYYVLVHLNLFGTSYLQQVKGILRRYL